MRTLIIALSFWIAGIGSVAAELRAFTCEPEWAALLDELGGDRVAAYSATTAHQNPHRIEARPSLIAKLRRSDLLLCSGAELEVGWLPMLLRQAGNAEVQPGQIGHLEAAQFIELIDKPEKLDRSMGDVHASGNPHFHLDPQRLLQVAQKVSERLQQLDPSNADFYRSRLQDFSSRWQQAITGWQQRAEVLKGSRMVVHHKDWRYLFRWLGIEEAATLEPKPGIAPSAAHLARLKKQLQQNPASLVVYSSYQSDRAAKWLSGQADIPIRQLPYTVGGADGADDLFGLFDVIIDRLLQDG